MLFRILDVLLILDLLNLLVDGRLALVGLGLGGLSLALGGSSLSRSRSRCRQGGLLWS